MSRLLYLDCPSGVSGDMLLGAIIDLGVEPEAIAAPLRALPMGEWSLRAEPVRRAGQRATLAVVEVPDQHQAPRRLAEIEEVLARGALPGAIEQRARSVFRRLANAEARVHGECVEEMHVHEVGQTDAVVDVVGTLVGLAALEVEEGLYCSALPLASEGTARSAHGSVPLPAPATLELLQEVRAPLRAGRPSARAELVTPTGAALVAELATFTRPAMRLDRIGIGAGGRDPAELPNVLRAWLGEAVDVTAGAPTGVQVGRVVVLETTVDDMTPEQLSYAMERVRSAGALDVWAHAVSMKKARSGVQITAIARPESEPALAGALLRETSTLGVRVHEERRYEADRAEREIETPLGSARVKVKQLPGEPLSFAPEFEDCAALAREHARPIAEVFALVEAAARQAWGPPADGLGGGGG